MEDCNGSQAAQPLAGAQRSSLAESAAYLPARDAVRARLFANIYRRMGWGIPFLVLSVVLERAFTFMRWLRHYTRQIQILSGLLLVAMGVLVLTNQLFYVAIWAQQNGLYLDPQLGHTTTPTYLLAILAGLLSFLSPCVLPLVPAYIAHLSHYAVEQAITNRSAT